MEYLQDIRWWHIVAFLVVCGFFFGKGGVVRQEYRAKLKILDDRFVGCDPKAYYRIFKAGRPEKFEIDIDRLDLPEGEELEFTINGSRLAMVKVDRGGEAEFEHWSDDKNVRVPKIKRGDEVVIKYKGKDVMEGTYEQTIKDKKKLEPIAFNSQ